MSEEVVTDSTCLIGLERINRLDLLPALFTTIWIPPEVEREFGTAYDWLHVQAPSDTALVDALKLMVDDGEAEAIALAGEKQLKIILDDRQARTVAKRLKLGVIGTIGCFLRAKQAGILTEIRPQVEALESVDFILPMRLKKKHCV